MCKWDFTSVQNFRIYYDFKTFLNDTCVAKNGKESTVNRALGGNTYPG
jgi:hypothetical protein